MPLATQPTARPTNKALTMYGAFPALLPLVRPPVTDIWPVLVALPFGESPSPMWAALRDALAGPAMTDAVAALIAGAGALALAWFVPDRANVEQ